MNYMDMSNNEDKQQKDNEIAELKQKIKKFQFLLNFFYTLKLCAYNSLKIE